MLRLLVEALAWQNWLESEETEVNIASASSGPPAAADPQLVGPREGLRKLGQIETVPESPSEGGQKKALSQNKTGSQQAVSRQVSRTVFGEQLR